MSTRSAPTEEELVATGFYDDPRLEQAGEDIDWHGRHEVYVLPNGARLIARSEVEAAAYAKGAELRDVFYDD